MSENIEIKGLEKVLAKFGKLEKLRPQLVKTTEKAAYYVRGNWKYPPKSEKHIEFVSDKQRGWFFANLKEGKLQLPYRRTGTLGRTLHSEVREMGSNIVGLIGNNTVYAPWVISSEEVGSRGPQARMHKDFETLQDLVARCKNGVIQIYRNWIKGMID